MSKLLSISAVVCIYVTMFPGIFVRQCNLTVTITGLHSSKGKVYIYLYNSADGFPQNHSKANKALTATIVNNKCVASFDNIPIGSYAVASFHDENGNGKLDTNFWGIPTEGVGASNNAKGFMGPPKYSDALIKITNSTSIFILMNY